LGCRIAAAAALNELDSDRVVPLLLELFGTTSEHALIQVSIVLITRRMCGRRDIELMWGAAALSYPWKPLPEAAASPGESLLGRIFSLYQTHPTVEQLVQSALAHHDWEPSFLLLRLLHRPAAVERFSEIIRNHKQLCSDAIARLPFMQVSESTAQTLLGSLDDPASTLSDKVLAAIGVAALVLQTAPAGTPPATPTSEIELGPTAETDPDREAALLQAIMDELVQRAAVLQTEFAGTPPMMPTSFNLKDELVQRAADRQRPINIRVAAAVGVTQAGEDSDFEMVLERMKDPSEDQEFRRLACVMGRISDPKCPTWMSMFITLQRKYGRNERLADFLLERALEDESEAVRTAAAQGLEEAPGEVLRKLIDKLKDRETPLSIRLAAADALGRIGAPAGRTSLLDLLTDEAENQKLRVQVAVALGSFNDEKTVVALDETILGAEARDLNARMLAVFALYKIQGQDALDRLTALSLDPERDLGVRLRIVEALGLSAPLVESVLQKLFAVAMGSPDDIVRVTAAILAHHHKPGDTIAKLQAALVDKEIEEELREGAAIGLVSLGSPEAESVLEEISHDLTDRFAAGTAAFALEVGEWYKEHKTFPEGVSRLFKRASKHLEVGSTERGLSDLDELVKRFPDNASLRDIRSHCLRTREQSNEALIDALKATDLAPQDASMQVSLGEVYLKLDRTDDALCAFRRAIELQPDLAEPHAEIAAVASARGHDGEALVSGREAVRLAPENGSYLVNLAWYAYEAGELTESIDVSRRAIQITPNEPMAFFNLGLALLASSDGEAALKEYDSGLEACTRLAPDDACLNIEGAVGDLETLIKSRSDLARFAGDIKKTLQARLTEFKLVGH
jgi:tetratricopeptide (TPR) repeat protein